MEKLAVGEEYPGKLLNGVYLDYDGVFTLHLHLPNLTNSEIKSISEGSYRFALTEISDMLIFLYEFKDGIKLSDIPFHFGLYDDNKIKELPNIEDDPDGLPLNVIAVDSATGIIKVIRLIGLETRFSQKLIDVCINQSQQPINRIQHNENVANLQQKYSSKDLMKFSSVICKG